MYFITRSKIVQVFLFEKVEHHDDIRGFAFAQVQDIWNNYRRLKLT